jgi:hypothetical protein
MQLLSWSILANAAASSDAALEAAVGAGLLQLLLQAVTHGITAGNSSSSVSSTGWFQRLSPEQVAATRQLAWSTLTQVSLRKRVPDCYRHCACR